MEAAIIAVSFQSSGQRGKQTIQTGQEKDIPSQIVKELASDKSALKYKGEKLGLKEEEQRPVETFSVKTIAGKVEDVPVTRWKELVPYWENICRAIFEVLHENDFKPYTATLKSPKGFVASSSYWNLSLKNPEIPFVRSSVFHVQTSGKAVLHEFNKTIQPKNPEKLVRREEHCHSRRIYLQLLLRVETCLESSWGRHQGEY